MDPKRPHTSSSLHAEDRDDSARLTRSPAAAHAETVRQLFQDHNRSLLGFLFGKLNSEAEAHEVAQEAYVRLLQLEQPGAISFLRSYLFRIAGNLAIDRLRHRRVRDHNVPQDLFEELLAGPSPERAAIAEQEFEVLVAALKELPPSCRQACALHFFADRTITDIAKELGLTRRCIHNYIARGLEHCRLRLGKERISFPKKDRQS
jgi:RNA polymerase sigma factor (sigma-70 family)